MSQTTTKKGSNNKSILSPEEKREDDQTRLLAKTRITGACITFIGATDPKTGYGLIRVCTPSYPERAHRVAYALAHGLEYHELKGKVVRHQCNNPSCVNPAHLELGTSKDNFDDMIRDGRSFNQKLGEARKVIEEVLGSNVVKDMSYQDNQKVREIAKSCVDVGETRKKFKELIKKDLLFDA